MGEGLGEGDLGGVVAPELPLRPGATDDRRLVVAAGRAFGEGSTGAAAGAAELTAVVLVGVGRAGAGGAGVTAPDSVDLAVSSGAGGWESAAPGVTPEAAPDLAVVDPVRGGRLTIAFEVVEELERKGGWLGTGMRASQGDHPSGSQKSIIPPMVRSVCTSGLPQAKRAAEPLAVNTQLPGAAPTGSTATLSLPLPLRSTRRLVWANPCTLWVQTSEPVTCMISISSPPGELVLGLGLVLVLGPYWHQDPSDQ